MHPIQKSKVCSSVSQRHLYQPHPFGYFSLLRPETGRLGDTIPRPQFGGSIRVWCHSWLKAAWHRGPSGATDLVGSWKAGQQNNNKKSCQLDQWTYLADYVAAWLLVLAQSDWGESVCVCVYARMLMRKAGEGAGKVVQVGLGAGGPYMSHSLN